MEKFLVQSKNREEMIDVTHQVQDAVKKLGLENGIVTVFTPHTTAAVTINENADPDVQRDILLGLRKIVSDQLDYRHAEGNSPAHIKSSLVGCSVQGMVKQGKLVLGTWQGIYFCEFDGPRSREVWVK
jgi:secondary thiamine-phosphate synthase enzyme